MPNRSNATQYQSFPDAPGDSESLSKLKKLRLPSLVAKRFLDIGCNEGFFCGYAKFAGACEVVGLDASALFVERARKRYPQIEFLHQSWDSLPSGPFDVILLASSLHYAEDPSGLIDSAVKLLAAGGTLVLELGIAEGDECAWVDIERGSDKRMFPTWTKVSEMLDKHAWKYINRSTSQKGDPVPRYTIHINERRPIAYLLMQSPGYGKSTLCRTLFRPAGVPIVSGDQCLFDVAKGQLRSSRELEQLVATTLDPDAIDRMTRSILEADLLPALIDVWLLKANGCTFVLDSSVPKQYQAQVEQTFANHGFLVVKLDWERPGAELQSIGDIASFANAYVAEMQRVACSVGQKSLLPFTGTLGAITKLAIDREVLEITGWAVNENGQMPELLAFNFGTKVQLVSAFERFAQPQLQSWLSLPHSLYGYRFTVPAPQGLLMDELANALQVFGGKDAKSLGSPFRSLVVKPLSRY